MSTPLVSVVLAFRNPGRYLLPAVESILGQTFRDLELIAVDDGSTDGSAATLAPLASADPRLRVIRQEALGFIPALRRGIALARGSLIGRMDADDLSHPERLERQVAFLERNPHVAVLGTNMQMIKDSGPTTRVTAFPERPEDIRAALLRFNPMSHPTVVMRRGPYVEVGGYRSPFKECEDYDLWLRLSERHDMANLPDVLFQYRIHGNQSVFERLEQQRLGVLAAVECARRRRAGEPDPAERLTGPVSWSFLRELGLDLTRCSDEVAERYGEAVQVLLRDALPDHAVRLAETLEAGVGSGRLVGPRSRAESQVAWFRIERRRGRWLRALAHLLRAARAAPDLATRRVARGLTQRLRPS